ncbi:MAG: iron ABC transporter permease [Spirochaetaceae bacterium]|nr:MAG: iron ABC transporter permease [Spirochaetaceae bacterium]
MLLPLLYLVIRALEAEPAQLLEMLWRERTWLLLRNTLQLTGSVLILTTLISLPLAWLVARTDLPGRRIITILAVMPLAIPGYVMAHALLSLGGANGIGAALGFPMARLQGLPGAALALSLYAFPYLFLNIRSALLSLDPGTEESARSLGYAPRTVFRKVILPMIFPGLIAGWLIIALYTLGDFGAVALMRFEVFSFAIYTQYSGAFDRTYAAALALILLALAAVPLVLETRLLRHHNLSRVGTGVSRPIPAIPLNRWKGPALLFVTVVVVSSVGLPLLSLLYWMTLRTPWDQLGRVALYFRNSVSAALPAALLAVVAALPVAYLRVRFPSRTTLLMERTAYIGYAVPPLALALAFVFFSLRAVPFLYQTLLLLIIAWSMNFLALAMGPIRSGLLLAPRRLEEAARSLGKPPLTAFIVTVLPVLREGIFASMTLVFVMALKELPIAFLLAPTGFTTLSVAVFSRTSEGMLAEAAPFAAAIVLLSSMFVGLMLRYEGREIT